MTPQMWGGALGLLAGAGLLLVIWRVRLVGRPQVASRVLPFVHDVPRLGRLPISQAPARGTTNVVSGVFGPLLSRAAQVVERVLGGSASVGRRLQRAGIDKSVHEFRIEQVVWGIVAFAVAAAFGLLRSLDGPGGAVRTLVVCLVAFTLAVMARDTYLSTQVKNREAQMVAEFPVIAELLALAVAAGESPVAALDRVVRRSGGELSRDLGDVLAAIRTGEPVAQAFETLSRTTGLPVVARFAQGVAVAIERGTPLADVLHAQAADVRESGRRDLIEAAARKEVLMMIPVVFLVMPVTVLFAFWPGAIALRLNS